MSNELLIETVVGAIAASGGLAAIIPKLINWWQSKRHMNALRRIKTVYGVLNTLLVGTHATRVCVLETSNGGGVPMAGRPLYIRSLYEFNALETPGNRALWKEKQSADSATVELIVDLQSRTPISRKVLDMPDGQLRLLAEAMDADKLVLARLSTSGTRMLVLAVLLPDDSEMRPQEEQLLHESAATLTHLLK